MKSSKTIQEIEEKQEELGNKIYDVITQFDDENEDIKVTKVEYGWFNPLPVEVIFWVNDSIIKSVNREGKGKSDGFA